MLNQPGAFCCYPYSGLCDLVHNHRVILIMRYSALDAPIFACNATITPGTSTMGDALLKYFDEVKTWTDGQVVIDMFDGGQLGADLEMVFSNQSGVVDIYWSNPANLNGIIPELAVFDISGLYDSPVQCNYVIKKRIHGSDPALLQQSKCSDDFHVLSRCPSTLFQ